MDTLLHCYSVFMIPVTPAEADHMAALDEPPEKGEDPCHVITALLETLSESDARLSQLLYYVVSQNNGSLVSFVAAQAIKPDGLGVKDMLRMIFGLPLPNPWQAQKLTWTPDCTRIQVVVPTRVIQLPVAVGELARRLE